jgi:hypothetical protein
MQAGALGTLLLLLVRLLPHFFSVAIINGLLLYLVCRLNGVTEHPSLKLLTLKINQLPAGFVVWNLTACR